MTRAQRRSVFSLPVSWLAPPRLLSHDLDGDCGKGSLHALSTYYKNTKRMTSATQPIVELLGKLFLHSGRAFKEPVTLLQRPRRASVACDVAPVPSKGCSQPKKCQKLAAAILASRSCSSRYQWRNWDWR